MVAADGYVLCPVVTALRTEWHRSQWLERQPMTQVSLSSFPQRGRGALSQWDRERQKSDKRLERTGEKNNNDIHRKANTSRRRPLQTRRPTPLSFYFFPFLSILLQCSPRPLSLPFPIYYTFCVSFSSSNFQAWQFLSLTLLKTCRSTFSNFLANEQERYEGEESVRWRRPELKNNKKSQSLSNAVYPSLGWKPGPDRPSVFRFDWRLRWGAFSASARASEWVTFQATDTHSQRAEWKSRASSNPQP